MCVIKRSCVSRKRRSHVAAAAVDPPLLLKFRLPAAQVRENRILWLVLPALTTFENF